MINACLLLGAVFVASGYNVRTDAVLKDYSVSQDGTQITMQVCVAGSIGYIRDYRAELGGFNLYVKFYTPYGGFNSSLDAKDTFVLEVDPINCEEIYFYHGDGGYTLALQKDPLTGQWQIPQ